MTTPHIITDEQEISVYNTQNLVNLPKDPRFDYNPFRRLSARIIDDFLIFLGILVIIAIFVGLSFLIEPLKALWIIIGFLLVLVFQTLFKPLLEYYYNQTPGQMINSLLLTTENGTKPTFIHLFLRSLLEWVNAFFPIHIVSVFTVPLRDDRQSVSDLICSTRVETTKTYPNMVIWSTISGIVAFITPFIVVIGLCVLFWAAPNKPPYDPSLDYSNKSSFNSDFDTEYQKELDRIYSQTSSSSVTKVSEVSTVAFQPF